MKCTVQILFSLFVVNLAFGQNQPSFQSGLVTFISSKNVYVKFDSTKDIEVGDSLFVNHNGELAPALKVYQKSSSSVVCTSIGTHLLNKGDELIAKMIVVVQLPKVEEKKKELDLPFTVEPPVNVPNDPVIKPIEEDEVEDVLFKEKIKGRVSAATYNNFSDYRNITRMRYAFSYRGYNLNNSRFSVENYMTFRHTSGEWHEVTDNIANALKIYSLSVKYDFDKTSSLTLGRKINPRFSSMGAIDGLQYEKGLGSFRLGAIAGTRPDFADYSFNPSLLQFGGYVSHVSSDPKKYSQTTLGLVEQMNKGNTDRRFVYFQHSSQLGKKVNVFGSFEVDLFENINGQKSTSPRLTNLYASLRYRINRNWRVSASYDNRRNIIYYESYKNFIDQLIEDETRQGLRFSINHRTSKLISWGINAGTRFQKSMANPSRNINGHVTISRVPFINARATLRANYLQTNFMDSRIFGIRLNKDLVPGKINGEVYYRWVDYLYKNNEINRMVHQNIGGASVSFRIQKNLSLYLYYEGVFDQQPSTTYHRFNAKIIKRF